MICQADRRRSHHTAHPSAAPKPFKRPNDPSHCNAAPWPPQSPPGRSATQNGASSLLLLPLVLLSPPLLPLLHPPSSPPRPPPAPAALPRRSWAPPPALAPSLPLSRPPVSLHGRGAPRSTICETHNTPPPRSRVVCSPPARGHIAAPSTPPLRAYDIRLGGGKRNSASYGMARSSRLVCHA